MFVGAFSNPSQHVCDDLLPINASFYVSFICPNGLFLNLNIIVDLFSWLIFLIAFFVYIAGFCTTRSWPTTRATSTRSRRCAPSSCGATGRRTKSSRRRRRRTKSSSSGSARTWSRRRWYGHACVDALSACLWSFHFLKFYLLLCVCNIRNACRLVSLYFV